VGGWVSGRLESCLAGELAGWLASWVAGRVGGWLVAGLLALHLIKAYLAHACMGQASHTPAQVMAGKPGKGHCSSQTHSGTSGTGSVFDSN
jgi:hypothetical protein